MDPISEPDIEAAWSAEVERRLVEIDEGTVELILWDDVRSELFGEFETRRIMTLDSETVETLEAAALQLTPADRARLVERLIATLDADPKVEEAWAGSRTPANGNRKRNCYSTAWFGNRRQTES